MEYEERFSAIAIDTIVRILNCLILYVVQAQSSLSLSLYLTTLCIQQADEGQLCKQILPRPSIGATKISPLVGAAFSSNRVLFWRVYGAYEKLTEKTWLHDKVSNKLRSQALMAVISVSFRALSCCLSIKHKVPTSTISTAPLPKIRI